MNYLEQNNEIIGRIPKPESKGVFVNSDLGPTDDKTGLTTIAPKIGEQGYFEYYRKLAVEEAKPFIDRLAYLHEEYSQPKYLRWIGDLKFQWCPDSVVREIKFIGRQIKEIYAH